ncbi:MAG TPA: hypothetical protein O0X39_05465 [Methanocorpusculum sp.]|nr:hypothetical protein [Methanocorpusculum sp.]
MTLTPKQALVQYHESERLKLDIMMIAHQMTTITNLKKDQKVGAKYMLVTLMDVLTGDTQRAAELTGCAEFTKAADLLKEVMELADTNQFGLACDKAGEAMIPVTNAAVEAFEVLSANGLV